MMADYTVTVVCNRCQQTVYEGAVARKGEMLELYTPEHECPQPGDYVEVTTTSHAHYGRLGTIVRQQNGGTFVVLDAEKGFEFLADGFELEVQGD